MSLKTETIKIECTSCSGTGIYRGFAEPQGVGVVCHSCNGTGAQDFKYAPFNGRAKRNDIQTVQRSRGTLIVTGVGPVGRSISYGQFLAGEMP